MLHLITKDSEVDVYTDEEPIDNFEDLLDAVSLDFTEFDPAFKNISSIPGFIKKIHMAGLKGKFNDTSKVNSWFYSFQTDPKTSDDDICFVMQLTNLRKLNEEDIPKSNTSSHYSHESWILSANKTQYLFELIWEG